MTSEQGERFLGSGLFWQDMPEGSRFRTPARTILASEIRAFVNLTGMVEPLFVNRERAGGVLHGDVCPGAYLLSVSEGLVLNGTVRDTGLALMGLSCRFRGPLFAGETIHVLIEVTGSRASSESGRGVVTTRNIVRKGDADVVLEYEVVRLVSGRE